MNPEASTNGFSVKTPAYEGPLELLLDLIESRKLLVNDISLASVTDEYVAHIRGQATFPMEAVAHFIQIAATLILIKSKSLIPDLTLTEEEEADIHDLEERLRVYEKVREAARALSQMFGRKVLLPRGEQSPEAVFAPSEDLTKDALASALAEAISAMEKKEKLPEARIRPMVTIEEMMDRLAKRVQSSINLSFKEFSAGTKDRIEVIVSFLALLELVKQGAVEISQRETFADIHIHNTQTSVPRYG